MGYCRKIFGKYAFRKYNSQWRRGPINKALFECWSLILAKMPQKDLDILVQKRNDLLEQFQTELTNTDYVNALKAGDPYSVARRITMTEMVVKEIV
jgi:hypothetical protein